MTGKWFVLATTLVLSLGAYAGEAAAQTKIKTCGPITSPGSYLLGDNLVASGNGDCLVLQADFVTIDLGGFLIEGNATGHRLIPTPHERNVSAPSSSALGEVRIRRTPSLD